MQAIKNGIKCTIRTPGKTLLFTLILIVTAALLTVSFCVFGAVRGYLRDCDSYFHTIAELEYIGRDYPDKSVYDEALAAAVEENRAMIESLIASDSVLSFEPASSAIALSPQMHRRDLNVHDPNAAVLRLYIVSYDERLDIFSAIVEEPYYSRNDYSGKLILVRSCADQGSFETGATYVMAGHFFKGSTNNPWFQQEQASFTENGEEIVLPLFARFDGELPENDPFLRYARSLNVQNNSCRVTFTSRIEDEYPFHQQILSVMKGRLFTAEEYEHKAHVVVLSDRITGLLGKGVGDSIPLEVFTSNGDIYDMSLMQSHGSGDYQIIGIFKDNENYPYWMFMPDADAASASPSPVNGYTLGVFRLDNESAPKFLEAASGLSEKGFRLSLYDQGYSAATEPMRELLLISGIFLAVCLLLALSALAVQSHLFVSRQRETAKTMYALGSGKKHVFVYFLSAALLLTAVASAIGAVVGSLLEGRVVGILKRFTEQFAGQDLRFSDSRLALVRTLDFDPAVPLSTYLLSALLPIVCSALFTLIFTSVILHSKKQSKKQKNKEKRAVRLGSGHTSRLSGALKYALLSARRGIVRTVAVILMGAVTAVFFTQLTSSLESYRVQLDNYRKNASVTGYATDASGRMINGLVVKGSAISRLMSQDLISDFSLTRNLGHLVPLGVTRTADGEEHEVPYSLEFTSFTFETTFDSISKGPKWLAASSVSRSPMFHFKKANDIKWLEGFNEKRFLGCMFFCVLPEEMMRENGIGLGDVVRFMYAYNQYVDYGYYHSEQMTIWVTDLQVVGSYVSSANNNTVFSPIGFIQPSDVQPEMISFIYENGQIVAYEYGQTLDYDGAIVTDDYAIGIEPVSYRYDDPTAADPEGDDWTIMNQCGLDFWSSFDSFLFTLNDTDRLDELREKLTDGFAPVNSRDRLNNYAVIEDEMYLNTTHSMERQIQYVSVLYYSLYLLAGVIGFTIAWLLTQSRRKEIAVMRALGTPPIRIVLNFLTEQLMLIAAGLALGVFLSYVFKIGPSKTGLMLTAAFMLVWCLAALICLIAGLVKRSYAALTELE